MPRAKFNKAGQCLALACLVPAAFTQTASVTGQVTETLHGKPLDNVAVALRGQPHGAPPEPDVYTTHTDSQGRFAIRNIAPGKYSVSFTSRGYLWPVRKDGTAVTPHSLVLQPDQSQALPLELMPASVISGRTLDADGDPERNVSVQALQYSYVGGKRELRAFASAQSNDRGEYRLYDLPPGAYLLEATARGGIEPSEQGQHFVGPRRTGSSVTYYPSSSGVGSAAPFQVAAGDEARGVDIHLLPVLLYSIRVRMPHRGGPMPEMVLRSQADHGQTWNLALPRVIDELESGPLPPGSYMLTAFTGLPGSTAPQTAFRLPIEVMDHDVEIDAPPLTAGLDVPGAIQVDGAAPFPLQRLRVVLWARGLDFMRSPEGNVAADGSFVLHGAMPASYTLQVAVPEGAYLKTVQLGKRVLPDLSVDFSDGVEPLTILLGTDGGRIQGSVENAAGDASAGTAVTLFPEGPGGERQDRARRVLTDAEGKYVFKDVAPGDYRIFAWDTENFSATFDPDFRKAYEGQSVTVSVVPGGALVIALKTVVQR